MSTLGSRIKESREKKRMLQSELAAAIGVKSPAVISNWEQDINKPDADKIIRLCSVLGITASYLLDYYGAEEVTASEYHLLHGFRELNEEGQQIVLHTVQGLIASKCYIKTDSETGSTASA